MKKLVIALSILIGFGSCLTSAVADEAEKRRDSSNLDLGTSVPMSLDYNLNSTQSDAKGFGNDSALTLQLDDRTGSPDTSLRDELLARVTPFGFRVGDSSYLNVSLEKGVMVGVTIPWQGQGL